MRRSVVSTFISLLFVLTAQATSWTVGPSQTYTMPSQVSTLVADGDTVNIEAGVYPSDVARWTADNLVMRGVGGLAHLESNGMSWGGKAIWVIQGNNTSVEWVEFSECSVPDQNGAGIRLEGLNLTVRHCWFHENENGILAGEIHPCTILIEYTEFAYNGFGDGYSHNLYIGNVDSLIFRYNYSHHAHVGHELKSRAWVNVIEYNRIGNEADGDASREIDLPNGGQAFLIGNVIQQGLMGENSNMVGFGMEGLSNPGPQELYAANNTLVNEKANGSFFQAPAEVFFKAYSNILAGGGDFMASWPTSLDTLANARATDIMTMQFANAATFDYHIAEGSPAHNEGVPAGLATSGYPLVALSEYVHPTSHVLRCQQALLDAGAFETCSTGINTHGSEVVLLYPNPAWDHITLEVRDRSPLIALSIIDARGRMIEKSNGPGAILNRIPLHDLAPGLYTIRASTSSGTLEKHFVKLP